MVHMESGPKESGKIERSRRSRGEHEQNRTIGNQKRQLFIRLCLGGIEELNLPSGFFSVIAGLNGNTIFLPKKDNFLSDALCSM